MSLEKIPRSGKGKSIQPSVMNQAFEKAGVAGNKEESERRFGTSIGEEVFETIKNIPKTILERSEEIPIELAKIYKNERPPKDITDLYLKLPPQKRSSYLQLLTDKRNGKASRKPVNKKNRHPRHQERGKRSRTVQMIAGKDKSDLVNPWGVYGKRRETAQEEFKRMYPSGQPIPLDTLKKYKFLMNEQIKSFGSGDVDEQKRIASEIESFIIEQRAKIAENLSSQDLFSGVGVVRGQVNSDDTKRARIKKLRDDIATFELEIAHPTYPRTHDVIERDALAAEEELRNLELTLRTGSVENKVPATGDELREPDLATRSVLEEGMLIANPDLALDSKHARRTQEYTPREWRNKLRVLLEKFGVNERDKSLEKYSKNRLDELDAESKKLGRGENIIRSLGEKYNKFNFLQKLGIGLTLGVGAAAFTGVSFPVATACTFGLGVQRAFGMASMFLKFEKQLQESTEGKSEGFITRRGWYKAFAEKTKNRQKETAILMAVGYSLLMSAAIKETVQIVNESLLGERIHEWLGYTLGHTTSASAPEATAPLSVTPDNVSLPTEIVQQNHVGMMTGMPTIDASTGHGYEYMAKKLWEELNARGIKLPANANPHSDLARLLAAHDDASINKVVQQIASDSRHAFSHANGMSVRIDPNTHMTIGTDGQIHLSIGKENFVHAPVNATVTPPYHAVASTQIPSVNVTHHESMIAHSSTHQTHEVGSVDNAMSTERVVHPHMTTEHITQPVSTDSVVHDGTGGVVHDGEGNPVYERRTYHKVSDRVSTPVHAQEVFTNVHNIHVNLTETHGYSNGEGVLYVMGGDKAVIDNQAQDYALTHHVPVFVDKSYKLLGVINVPRVVEYVPTNNGSLEMVIHSGPSWIPNPKNFTKRIF